MMKLHGMKLLMPSYQIRGLYLIGLNPNSNPNPDAWRISIDNDFYDEMAGFETYDSRLIPQNFDIINYQFIPPTDIDFDSKISWQRSTYF